MIAPRELTDERAREMARQKRDEQWAFADKAACFGTLWFCWWDKNGRHTRSGKAIPDDLVVCGLIDGIELLGWIKSHPDWWIIGEWNDERYAAPVSITSAGRAALAERDRYDMEPVTGGLVEPGWQAVPTAKAVGR